MSQSDDYAAFDVQKFSGVARLFPLPNLVLFPHVIQPLHIFEPRYVDMLLESLESDRLIAMSLLQPGWERDYEGRPPIAPVACLARVLNWQEVPDSRYNLLAVGLRRVRIARELPPSKKFREAEVEVLDDYYPAAWAEDRPNLQRSLTKTVEKMLPLIDDAADLFNQLSLESISLGTLTDVVSYALDLNTCDKQELLTEHNVDRRAQKLLMHLKRVADQACHNYLAAGFPPSFSAN